MAQYRTVEGSVDVIDTLTNLTTFASEAAVGPVKVPASASRLVEIWTSVAVEIAASEENTYVLRLSGKGMKDGDQDFNIGSAAAMSGTAAGNVVLGQLQRLPVQIAVTPNETINVAAAITGTAAAATGQVGVTLVFA